MISAFITFYVVCVVTFLLYCKNRKKNPKFNVRNIFHSKWHKSIFSLVSLWIKNETWFSNYTYEAWVWNARIASLSRDSRGLFNFLITSGNSKQRLYTKSKLYSTWPINLMFQVLKTFAFYDDICQPALPSRKLIWLHTGCFVIPLGAHIHCSAEF